MTKDADPVPDQDPVLKVVAYHDTDARTPDQGTSYLHCGECLREWQEGLQGLVSPKQYARQQCALTKDGIQVWCTRHDQNITHIQFRAERRTDASDANGERHRPARRGSRGR